MNFLDTYDISGSSTPPRQPQQSLNEEVDQVIGQFKGFWGGFTRQLPATFANARKDFGDVVLQAQKELTKLTGEAPKEPASEARASTDGKATDSAAEAGPSNEKGGPSTESPTSAENTATSSNTVQALFSRLQSAIPPNVVTTVQKNLPESIKHATEGIDLSHLRESLSTEFHRVQGVTRVQAEEYIHRSEAMLREAMKEAGEVLKDAVKVIPPEGSGSPGDSSGGLVWDGTDMWMLPSDPNEGAGKGKGKETAQQSVATRAESLLRQLRTNPEIMKHDPEADKNGKELYAQWAAAEVDAREGGVDSDEWKSKIATSLKESQELQATHDALVPSNLSQETFWKRYFFRVHQIQTEEAKRKALIQGSVASDDEFSWEDDDDDEPSVTATPSNTLKSKSSTTTLQPDKALEPASDATSLSSQATTPATTSPRGSSDESYDVVSSTSGNVSAAEKGKRGDKKAEESDEADSDWE